MKFKANWQGWGAAEILLPTLNIGFHEQSSPDEILEVDFLINSALHYSFAPKEFGDYLSVDWDRGQEAKLPLMGEEVSGALVPMTIVIPQAHLAFPIPLLFVKGNPPFMLGLVGFFDYMKVQFDKQNEETEFELIAPI